jgi:mRNA-degrading endonuclease toxin of MazEF toxin-antitoxin module
MVKSIYLAKIMFSDSSVEKIRPVLIIQINQFHDLIFLPLTSNLDISGVMIETDNLISGKLPKASVIVYDKIGVIHNSNLLKKIGEINAVKFHEVIDKLCEFLNNQTK